ncbi:ABC transporter substrate-binding protein [Peptoniphilus duerdenii]|uniref:ABC transporter substrate-binding protein n=1 Tax=Peptoniphilus duerdenii TaxID=507750 RepID=UPI0023F50C7E|nr:ABC transporter substrate-binding protein [Peptoniphilus duerdenii]
MKKRLLIVVFGLLLFMTGCGNKEADLNTFRVAVSADGTSLDPTDYNDVFSENILKQIFDTLLDKAPNGDLVNGLAESLERPDNKTLVIKIREGVKFSNGEPLTVEDVIFSLKRVAECDQFGYIFKNIDTDNLRKIDDTTLEIKLKEPDATILEALAHPASSIISQKDLEEKGENFRENPIGTGPFVLDKWTKLDSVTFKRNENYWGDKPSIENLVFKVIPEASQRIIELESGGVDMAFQIAPNDIKKVEENPDLKLDRKLDNSVHFVSFNTVKPPFDNINARLAMTKAIDMDTIFKTVYQGVGKRATSNVNPNFKYSIADSIEPTKVDKEEAKRLFAEAGMTEGTTIKIYVNDNQQRNDVAQMMKEQLTEYGINLEIVKLEWGALVEALKNKEDDMFIMSWTPAEDTHYEFYQPFHSDGKGNGPNFNDFGNAALDVLIDAGAREFDDAKRGAIYKEAQELVNKELPWMYICYGETVVGMKKNVTGFDIAPTYAQKFGKVGFEAVEK